MSEDLKKIAAQVRRDIVRMVHGCQSGHPGGSLGCTDFLVALYFKVMNRKPGFDMDGKNEDLFFLSNGHTSPLLYSVLAHAGYFNKAELASFRKLNSRLQGHPTTHEHLPGIRMSSGSLGQGMSVAIGAAITKKRNKDTSTVFSLHGDGELQEGQNWEAAMFAAHHKVGNLTVLLDANNSQVDGSVEFVTTIEPLADKWRSFGWHVEEVDGHNIEELTKAMNASKNDQPLIIIARTKIAGHMRAIPDTVDAHFIKLDPEMVSGILSQLEEEYV